MKNLFFVFLFEPLCGLSLLFASAAKGREKKYPGKSLRSGIVNKFSFMINYYSLIHLQKIQ